MAADIWLKTILIVRKETRCRHIGYSYRLTARVLLYAPSHRQDSTYHGLCYTSREALTGTRNSSMGLFLGLWRIIHARCMWAAKIDHVLRLYSAFWLWLNIFCLFFFHTLLCFDTGVVVIPYKLDTELYNHVHACRAGFKPIGPIALNWAPRLRGPRARV